MHYPWLTKIIEGDWPMLSPWFENGSEERPGCRSSAAATMMVWGQLNELTMALQVKVEESNSSKVI